MIFGSDRKKSAEFHGGIKSCLKRIGVTTQGRREVEVGTLAR